MLQSPLALASVTFSNFFSPTGVSARSDLLMSGIETLSSVAAIFQLVGYGHRAHSWLSDLSKRAQDPYQSLEEASKEVKGIISLVESIANASSEITSTKLALRECIDNAMSLQVLLERLKGSSGKDGWAAHRKNKVMLAMNWKNKDKEIEGIWKKVERNIGILQVSFSLSHIEISKKTLSIVENMSYAALGAHSLVERSGAAQRQAGPSKDRPTANTLQTSTLRNALSSAGMIEKSSTLPPRNPRFVGQKEVLREIGSKLELATQHERAVGLVGLGGVGYASFSS